MSEIDPMELWRAIGLLVAMLLVVAAAIAAWRKLRDGLADAAWALVERRVTATVHEARAAAAARAVEGDTAHARACDTAHATTAQRLDALEEHSAATRRAVYGDPPHSAGLLDRLASVEQAQAAEAARQADRHLEVVSRLDQVIRQGAGGGGP